MVVCMQSNSMLVLVVEDEAIIRLGVVGDLEEAGFNVLEAAVEITRRLTKLFLRDANGRRPCFGKYEKMQRDPHFRDYLLFHEFFHGDTGAGLGASHQTGWTALVAKLLVPRRGEKLYDVSEPEVAAQAGGVSVGKSARTGQQ